MTPVQDYANPHSNKKLPWGGDFMRKSDFAIGVLIMGSILLVGHRSLAEADPFYGDGFGSSLPQYADSWNGNNNPSNLKESFVRQFGMLPSSGKLDDQEIPWSDTYWPSRLGSIAYRWNAEKKVGWKYASPTREQVMKMSRSELAQLSPAEKYDIYRGRFDYPTKAKAQANASPRAKDWAGICHGWSPASTHHREPQPVDRTNPDGVVIPFGSSDVKGLLSFFYAFYAESEKHQLGARCFTNALSFVSGCKDVNAGAFHIVLANMIGIRKQGFVADVDRLKEVWNNPVYQFTSRVVQTAGPSRKSAPGTVKQVLVETDMTYTDELEDPLWNPVVGTDQFMKVTKNYKYWLELGSSDEILGGEWETYDRPDFLWTSTRAEWTGEWSQLSEIYQSAQ
jgi:hypothetical protein